VFSKIREHQARNWTRT